MPAKSKPDIEKRLKKLESELKKLKNEVEEQGSSADLLEEHKKAIDELMDSGVTVMKSLKKFYREQKEVYQVLGQIRDEMAELKARLDDKRDEKEYKKNSNETEGYQ